MSRSFAFAGMLAVLALGWSPPGASQADSPVCISKSEFTAPPVAPPATSPGSVDGFAIFEGATPPGLDPTTPVLVFVHGLHGTPEGWATSTSYHGRNDMYDIAYARGFKTFFVSLTEADGTAVDGLVGGRRLADQINAITTYWGIDKVNVVAHSMGGVTSNVAAIVGGRVDTMMTLSGAHYGSPLADLAQTEWLEWLGELLGFNDAGTKFMQTACMGLFRDLADARRENDDISVYTAAATSWGPALSALSFGGLYLAGVCGSNDGLVCVEDAKHPLARDASGVQTGEHRVVWDRSGDHELDHDNVRVGNAFLDFIEIPFFPSRDCYVPVFDAMQPYIGAFHAAAGTTAAEPADSHQSLRGTTRALAHVIRGGPLSPASMSSSFPVEDGARSLRLELLLVEPDRTVTLVAPDGRRYPSTPPHPPAGGLFEGAYVAASSVQDPLPGEWTVEFGPAGTGAYALVAAIDSPLSLMLRHSASPTANARRTLRLAVDGAEAEVETRVLISSRTDGGEPSTRRTTFLSGTDEREVELFGEGVHTMSLTATGSTADGWPFERSGVLSVAITVPNATNLPAACR